MSEESVGEKRGESRLQPKWSDTQVARSFGGEFNDLRSYYSNPNPEVAKVVKVDIPYIPC
jgi:hypothetical protein